MQERDGGSKGLGSGEADSSKQRAGCFLGEDQITDSALLLPQAPTEVGSRVE